MRIFSEEHQRFPLLPLDDFLPGWSTPLTGCLAIIKSKISYNTNSISNAPRPTSSVQQLMLHDVENLNEVGSLNNEICSY